MMKRFFYVLILLLVACNADNSKNKQDDTVQNDLVTKENKEAVFPTVGKPMPDIVLTNIEYHRDKEISLEDLKGKFVILDFWTRFCKLCIYSFPKVDKLNKQFKNRVELMLVTGNKGKHYDGTRDIYEKYRKRYDLEIPISYSVELFDKLGIQVVPHIIWIDEKGIVQAITGSRALTPENIESFLKAEPLDVELNLNVTQFKEKFNSFDRKQPLLINGNGGEDDDFMYRSLLTRGKRDIVPKSFGYFKPNNGSSKMACQVINVSLKELYKIAYGDTVQNSPNRYKTHPNCYGEYWYEPILDIKDTALFFVDNKRMEHIYCYSLMVPDNRLSHTLDNQRIMQRDLKNYFGYDVSVETRKMPYWALKATEKGKKNLITKGGMSAYKGNGLTYSKYINMSIKQILLLLWGNNQSGPPFLDETGITENIDIELDTILTDFDALKKALEKHGLLLEQKTKAMKVIVIRDTQS
ncbi:TlpA family protein disulfide reductase [Wocania ichthyoenteri]|uniref:TlpA family protein disulfide reductase n=1 Tax=Wocania ichthyoenteri TaxID=1230531 RepID=UPI00053DDE78|nr:redoxin domain-containing protein [Wocania ichthyoenteri]